MRVFLLFVSTFILGSALSARSGQVSDRILALQAKGARFVPVRLFETVHSDARTTQRWNGALQKATVLRPDVEAMDAVRTRMPEYMALELPTDAGSIILDLARTTITTDDFSVLTASGGRSVGSTGNHYRGMVRGHHGSWAAISVFDGEVMGLINDGRDEYVVGRLDDRRDDLHVLYNTLDLRRRSGAVCATPDDGEPYRPDQLIASVDRTIRCVRYYWEVNYNVFQDKGNLANTTTYITGLFNQSATLFDNDGIDVTLSEVFIWDVPSPYTQTTSGELLTQFGITRTSFNGDLAHLVGYNGGGGVAWVNTLCNSETRLRMAYSGINSSFSNVPTYSWSVEVVTHEAGHNLASRHTHACAWNGNATAIDGCGPAAGYTEGSCAQGPLPPSNVGGTIMSYCHLTSSGINFNNGFGPQPSAVIINAINSASCLGICGTSCDAPGNLSVQNLTTTTVTLAWPAVGAVSYTLRWKPTASSTWTTITGLTATTYALTGLTHSTGYEFQVLSVCASSSSSFSSSRTFTTLTPCPDTLEPNNSVATAADITLPASISALIAVNGDLDHYRFTLSATSTITVSLSNLPFDYDVRLLNSAGATLASSENGGTSAEFISYANAVAGTYYVYVFGYNGAFSVDRCYALFVNSFVVQTCGRPENPVISDITWSDATATWPAVVSVSSYDLRWKASASATWTDVPGLTTNTYAFMGLAPSTSYDVQVRSNCPGSQGGGTTSEYTGTTSFTTLAAPCAVAPPIVLPIKLVLDGAYRPADMLMVDSLRSQGVLPLQEPYTALGYTLSGSATTTAGVLAITGPNAITDWVVVELRDPTDPTVILEARAGLLQRDGDVVGMDGSSALGFCASPGPFHVAVHHRNHLGVMTANALSLGGSTPLLDFTLTVTATYGNGARRSASGLMALWGGNVNGDPEVKYAGSANDRDIILTAIGGIVPTNTVSGYRSEDCNLDGVVKYAGSSSDRDLILMTIGGIVPTNTVVEQVP
ncbi:MAG TPA: M12 family metallo-peptidase [Flavobacteriales bacterium]|nr:M12 family metallo-peptidase [Flavobacteriales bacterium]